MARFGLTQLPGKLAALTGMPAPSYRKCFEGAVGVRFPAQFSASRWTVDDGDLPQIADFFGMTKPDPEPEPVALAPGRRKSSSPIAA